jgi:hypothetical protein
MFSPSNYESLDEMLLDEVYMQKRRVSLLSRVYVDPATDCWNYTGCSYRGRARVSIGRKAINAARLAFVVFKNQPIGDKLVCHSCDNPSCINPEHLWLGTHADNMVDRQLKKRNYIPIGTEHGRCKLTEEEVRRIRTLYSSGVAYRAIARSFNLNNSYVRAVCLYHYWKHVK